MNKYYYLMENKGLSAVRRQIGVTNVQHNRLVTLVGCMYSEIEKLKKEIEDLKGNKSATVKEINTGANSSLNNKKIGGNKNLNEINANEILRQLSININENCDN
jgi:hypothetical protein